MKRFYLIEEIQLYQKGPTFGDSDLWNNLHHEDKETLRATPQKGGLNSTSLGMDTRKLHWTSEVQLHQICLEQQWMCKTDTNEGSHQEIFDTSDVVPNLRGSDWRDCADNNNWLGASPVVALWESGKEKATLKTSHNISSTVCQKAQGRLKSAGRVYSMVWWDQNVAFWP